MELVTVKPGMSTSPLVAQQEQPPPERCPLSEAKAWGPALVGMSLSSVGRAPRAGAAPSPFRPAMVVPKGLVATSSPGRVPV